MTEFMKIVMEFLVPVLLVILVLTQIVLPMFVQSLGFFWIFKKGGIKKISTEDEVDPVENLVRKEKKGIDAEAEDLVHEVTENADKLKKSTGKVDEVVSKLTDAKNNSLNNLNNQQQ